MTRDTDMSYDYGRAIEASRKKLEEHRLNYGRLYPGKSFRADCTCGWSCEGWRDTVVAAVREHENKHL